MTIGKMLRWVAWVLVGMHVGLYICKWFLGLPLEAPSLPLLVLVATGFPFSEILMRYEDKKPHVDRAKPEFNQMLSNFIDRLLVILLLLHIAWTLSQWLIGDFQGPNITLVMGLVVFKSFVDLLPDLSLLDEETNKGIYDEWE